MNGQILCLLTALCLVAAACGDSVETSQEQTDQSTEAPNEQEASNDVESNNDEVEECDPDWDYCPTAADLLIEDMGDFGLDTIPNGGPYRVVREPLNDVSIAVPCAEPIGSLEMFRAQSVGDENISLHKRGVIVWDSADDLAAHIEAARATEPGCPATFDAEILLEPVQVAEVAGWTGLTFSYEKEGERRGAFTQLANGDQMVFAEANTPGLAEALATSVVNYIGGGADSSESAAGASVDGAVGFCGFYNQIDHGSGVPTGDELDRFEEIADGLAANIPDEIAEDAAAYVERYRIAAGFGADLEAGNDSDEVRDQYFADLDEHPLNASNLTAWTDTNC